MRIALFDGLEEVASVSEQSEFVQNSVVSISAKILADNESVSTDLAQRASQLVSSTVAQSLSALGDDCEQEFDSSLFEDIMNVASSLQGIVRSRNFSSSTLDTGNNLVGLLDSGSEALLRCTLPNEAPREFQRENLWVRASRLQVEAETAVSLRAKSDSVTLLPSGSLQLGESAIADVAVQVGELIPQQSDVNVTVAARVLSVKVGAPTDSTIKNIARRDNIVLLADNALFVTEKRNICEGKGTSVTLSFPLDSNAVGNTSFSTDVVRQTSQNTTTAAEVGMVTLPQCRYWVASTASWSTEGCYLDSFNATTAVCRCSHLSQFTSVLERFIPSVNVITLKDLAALTPDNIKRHPIGLNALIIFYSAMLLMLFLCCLYDRRYRAPTTIDLKNHKTTEEEEEEILHENSPRHWKFVKLFGRRLVTEHIFFALFGRDRCATFTSVDRLLCLFVFLITALMVSGFFFGQDQTTESEITVGVITAFASLVPTFIATLLLKHSIHYGYIRPLVWDVPDPDRNRRYSWPWPALRRPAEDVQPALPPDHPTRPAQTLTHSFSSVESEEHLSAPRKRNFLARYWSRRKVRVVPHRQLPSSEPICEEKERKLRNTTDFTDEKEEEAERKDYESENEAGSPEDEADAVSRINVKVSPVRITPSGEIKIDRLTREQRQQRRWRKRAIKSRLSMERRRSRSHPRETRSKEQVRLSVLELEPLAGRRHRRGYRERVRIRRLRSTYEVYDPQAE
ncbi:MAG: hypothetical protein MHM6MM_004275 [Cercozoa sp. M6MM]